MHPTDEVHRSHLDRRHFIRRSMALASAPLLAAPPLSSGAGQQAEPKEQPAQSEFSRKIRLGVVGCGGRGSWIAGLFKKHGGYEMYAVADYFPEVAERCGNTLGVPAERRFSGLSGYRKLMAGGIEAVALETPPFFFPEHATAAVKAGLHVYSAKPVAVDVPGCLIIESLGRQATAKQRCYLVDYQMPTDPVNIEIVKRIHEGAMGPLSYIATFGFCGGFEDPPKGPTIENRLQHLTWVNDAALGCDYIGNYDIHAIDAALWVARRRPVSASGASRICRPDPHGDSRDVCSVVYEFADGLVLNHSGEALSSHPGGALLCQVFGSKSNADVNYWGKAFLRGGAQPYRGGEVQNLYEAGAVRNIAEFYRSVVEGRFDNPTVRRSVDGALTTILGREAAARRTRLTMDQLITENKRLEVDLSGLRM